MDLQIPLDIPNVEILKFDHNKRGEFIITVASKAKTTKCRKCQKEISKIHGYSDTIVLRHTSLFDNAYFIRIKLTRYKCDFCDDHPTTTEQPDWFKRGSKFTNAYEDYLMRMLINSTVLDVVRKEQFTYDEVEGTLNRQISTEVNWNKFSAHWLRHLSVTMQDKSFVTFAHIRENLRHESDEITRLYVHADDKQRHESLNKIIGWFE